MEHKWLFIVGPGRSFTTPTEYILNQHPDCFLLHESYFLHKFWNAAHGLEPEVSIRVGCGENHFKISDHPKAIRYAPGEDLLNQMTDGRRLHVVRTGCQFVRSHFPEVEFFGEKVPWVAERWRDYIAAFPKAKLVVTLRPVDEIMESQERWCKPDNPKCPNAYQRDRERVEQCLAACNEAAKAGAAYPMMKANFDRDPHGTILGLLHWVGLNPAKYPMAATIERLARADHIS